MSKATYVPAQAAVTNTIVVTPESPAKVVLELTESEAMFLANVLSHVGGIPEKSARKYQEPISDALRSAGFDNEASWIFLTGPTQPKMPMNGSIYCEDI